MGCQLQQWRPVHKDLIPAETSRKFHSWVTTIIVSPSWASSFSGDFQKLHQPFQVESWSRLVAVIKIRFMGERGNSDPLLRPPESCLAWPASIAAIPIFLLRFSWQFLGFWPFFFRTAVWATMVFFQDIKIFKEIERLKDHAQLFTVMGQVVLSSRHSCRGRPWPPVGFQKVTERRKVDLPLPELVSMMESLLLTNGEGNVLRTWFSP